MYLQDQKHRTGLKVKEIANFRISKQKMLLICVNEKEDQLKQECGLTFSELRYRLIQIMVSVTLANI